jgi:hypothetical protein
MGVMTTSRKVRARTRTGLVSAGLAVGLATFAVAVLPPSVAEAGPIVYVTNCSGSSSVSGSLPYEVANAPGGATIEFALSPPCTTITPASTMDIGENLTISGPGASALTVSGGGTQVIFDVVGVPSYVNATISGLTLEDGHSSNYGGAIYNYDATLNVTDSTLAGDIAADGGGAIYSYSNATLNVTDSTLSDDSATGGSYEYGGTIDNYGTMTVTGSTFSGDSADLGGGIFDDGHAVSITNSTFSGDSAAEGGGGFFASDAAATTIENSTFVGSTETGLVVDQTPLSLGGTIVADSASGGDCYIDDSPLTDLGDNLADDSTCELTAGSDLPDTSAGLDPSGLENNGGPTQTVALEPGSAAIDQVNNASLCPATDQRGAPRSVPCDIGAYDTDWGPAIEVDVSGSETFGGSPSLSYTTNAPGGIVSGTLTCSTVDGVTPISSADSGDHTVYGPSCSGLTSSDQADYPIFQSSYAGVTNGFTVSPLTVTVAVSGTQNYGGSPSFTYTTNAPGGIVSGTLVCTTVDGGTPISPATALGSYTVDGSSCSGLSSSDPTDAPISPSSYAGVSNGFVVSPTDVTVDVSGTQPDGGSPSLTYTTNAPGGIVSGTLVCTTVDGGTPIAPALAVGTHTVDGSSCSGLSSSDQTDYPLTPSSYSGVTNGFVVSQAVTVAVSGGQNYGGDPSFTYTTNAPGGIVSGTLVCTTVDGGTPITPTTALGSYTVDGSSCSGLSSSDQAVYPLTPGSYTGATNGFVVSPTDVTVEVSGSQPYRGGPTFTYTTNVPGGIVSGTLVCTTVDGGTPISSSLVSGSYTVDGSSCSGLTSSDQTDYPLTPGSYAGVTNGFLVTPTTLTVNVSGTQSYGGSPSFTDTTNAPGGIVVSGTLVCTTVDGGTPVSGLTVGSYTVDGSSCSGLTSSDPTDYPITPSSYSGVTNGFVVSPVSVTVDVSGFQGYGQSPSFTYTTNAPGGIVSGTLVCTTVDGGTPISPTTALGSYTVDGSSCSGLSSSDQTDYPLSPGSYAGVTNGFVVANPAGVWGPATEVSAPGGGGYFYAVSCRGATTCTAVGADYDNQPIYATESSGSWGPVTEIPAPGGGYFYGVSCRGATTCTAVGADNDNQAIYATGSSGSWGPVTEVTTPGGGGYFNAVSCSGATTCTAVGADNDNQPIDATESSGSWDPATEVSTPGGGGYFNAVSCSGATTCTAVGGDYDNQPIDATGSSGTWGPATEVTTPGGGGDFYGVGCSGATTCTAVGADNDNQPIVDSSAPAPATIDVSGTQVYGGSPNLSDTVDAPPGVVSGTILCTTVDGGTPISPSLTAGSYTIDGSSCSGLVSSDPTYYPITAGSYAGVTNGYVVSPPVVSEVDPATGFTTGTNTVTIVGSGFVNGSTTVDFGAANPGTNVDVTSSTTLTVTVPPGAAGPVDVTVTSPGGTSTETPADQYTYTVEQTVPQTEVCNASCPTNTETNALNQTSVSVAAPGGSPFASTSLTVNTDTLSCGASKTHNYDYPAAVSTLSATAFPPKTDLTVTETVGNEPTTKGVAVCFGVGSDPASGTLLHACTKTKKAPCLESLTEASGSVIATFLSPATDPRFWTGEAAPDLKTISPTKGAPGSTVTITGKSLTGILAVVIGGATATISSQSTATKLIVTVPQKAVSGLITLTTGSGEAVSAKPFTVT